MVFAMVDPEGTSKEGGEVVDVDIDDDIAYSKHCAGMSSKFGFTEETDIDQQDRNVYDPADQSSKITSAPMRLRESDSKSTKEENIEDIFENQSPDNLVVFENDEDDMDALSEDYYRCEQESDEHSDSEQSHCRKTSTSARHDETSSTSEPWDIIPCTHSENQRDYIQGMFISQKLGSLVAHSQESNCSLDTRILGDTKRRSSFCSVPDQRQQQQRQQRPHRSKRSRFNCPSFTGRGRSFSDSDIQYIVLKEIGRKLRRFSDDFYCSCTNRTLTTVHEIREEEDTGIEVHPSSYPGTSGFHHLFPRFVRLARTALWHHFSNP